MSLVSNCAVSPTEMLFRCSSLRTETNLVDYRSGIVIRYDEPPVKGLML